MLRYGRKSSWKNVFWGLYALSISKNVVCLIDDAKVRRFWPRSNKKDDFRQRSLWCIYDICDRNGNPCHNCRKRTKKSELSAQCRQPCEALAEWQDRRKPFVIGASDCKSIIFHGSWLIMNGLRVWPFYEKHHNSMILLFFFRKVLQIAFFFCIFASGLQNHCGP